MRLARRRFMLFAAAAPLIALVGVARAGDNHLTKEQLHKLIRSLYSDDSHERITAVVELSNHAVDAADALPHLKRVIAREDEPGIKKLMQDAYDKIKKATGREG